MTTRRSFLTGAAAVAALAQRPKMLWSQTASAELTLAIDKKKTPATMPAEFTGLSYESAQLGHPEFFAPSNTALIGLFNRLGARGVLRIGGNTEEYTRWSAEDADALQNHTPSAIGPDAGTAAKAGSIITPLAIRNLKGFIDRTGWRILYGLNLRHGSPENAAAEAKYVASTLGDKLILFQIGNEPDMNHADGAKDRWTFEYYYPLWQQYVAAVKQAVPGAKFAGPEIAKEMDWVTKMAEKRPDIEFLTGHYYAEGPPANPKMTLEFLLRRGRDPDTEEIPLVHKATKVLCKPYRMSEGNSCFHGGKLGVSDTFASALWSGDYMLQLAQAGYLGVNLHGGGNGLYTPIGGSVETGFQARPVYYGMLLAERFSGSTFVDAELSTQSAEQNVTAFAAQGPHGMKVAVFNKAAARVAIRLHDLSSSSKASMMWLCGSGIESKDGVTFGGSAVGPDGGFDGKSQESVTVRNGSAILQMPAYSAVVLEA